jgi:hypothetical protein
LQIHWKILQHIPPSKFHQQIACGKFPQAKFPVANLPQIPSIFFLQISQQIHRRISRQFHGKLPNKFLGNSWQIPG